jgi:hypothetical protein
MTVYDYQNGNTDWFHLQDPFIEKAEIKEQKGNRVRQDQQDYQDRQKDHSSLTPMQGSPNRETSPSILLPSTSLRVFDRAMSPSTMPFGPELTAEGLRTLRHSKGVVEWQACFPGSLTPHLPIASAMAVPYSGTLS